MPEREVWSSHQTRMTKMSKSLSKRFYFLILFCHVFFVSKIKQENMKMCHAFVPRALYLEAIKLNKENNTSLDVTLVNYFLRISSVFCGIFYFFVGFVFLFSEWNIWLITLHCECFLYNYSILRKCWIARSDGTPLGCSLNIVCESVIGKKKIM